MKTKTQRPMSDNNLNPNNATVSKLAVSTTDIIDELFHYDSQEVNNDLHGAGIRRERLDGTEESPNLMNNHDDDDYGNEVFSSGPLSFNEQWATINKMYRDKIDEGDKGFTSSDEEDGVTEDDIEDNA